MSRPIRDRPVKLGHDKGPSAPYDQTELKKSITLDVLPKIQRSEDELLSHSDNVVASLGQSKDGYRTWFNMVTFHEYRLNVIRKYFFLVDDKAGSLWTGLGRGLRFDCEMVLGKEVLEEPYVAENARRVAILRYVLSNLHKDIDELGEDIDRPGQSSKMLDVCGMLINQTFETIFLRLDTSRAYAAILSDAGGVEFDHINFDKGKVRMVVEDDIVMVKVRLGAFVREFMPR